MLYAKIVFGLPVEGPFDYIIPKEFEKDAGAGSRVIVTLGRKKNLGYITAITSKTRIKNVKPIMRLLDSSPILDTGFLSLTKELSEYYCCSWGQAIDTALPESLKKLKSITLLTTGINDSINKKDATNRILLVHCPDTEKRWNEVYFKEIKNTLNNNESIIILLPDKSVISKIYQLITTNFNCPVAILTRNQPDELNIWLSLKQNSSGIIIGTRSAVFAPVHNLGLIIIEEENQAYGYKQDQTPHYDARIVSYMRSRIDNASLILGSSLPSLESVYLARDKKLEYIYLPSGKKQPEIKLLDMKGLPVTSPRKNIILAKYLQDSITHALDNKTKILLFLNRLGFATTALCPGCKTILRCPRCGINMAFHYTENILSCHRCNYKIPPPEICPNCNSNYINYLGAGTEKVESEIARIFPKARIHLFKPEDDINILNADIYIASQSITKSTKSHFGLIGILTIDNSLNQVDFRAPEKTFNLLFNLIKLTDNQIIIQTNQAWHYCFKALSQDSADLFYDTELKQRKELKLPPFSHLAAVKIRGKNEEKVKLISNSLYTNLTAVNHKEIDILSLMPAYPPKLRENYYWQIVLRAKSPIKISKFLKSSLKKFAHSGIIITVDVDPI